VIEQPDAKITVKTNRADPVMQKDKQIVRNIRILDCYKQDKEWIKDS